MNNFDINQLANDNDIAMNIELKSSPWDNVQTAFEQGHFKPYEHQLAKRGSDWGATSGFETIKKIIQNKNDPEKNKKASCKIIYLFTMAIDPTAEESQIRHNINNYLEQLEADERKSLFYELKETEVSLSIIILKYCNKDFRDAVCKMAYKYKSIHEPEPFFFKLFLAAIDVNWSALEKKTFLDEFLGLLSLKNIDSLLYYFLNHASLKEQENFINICSDDWAKQINNLKSEIPKFCSEKILELELKPTVVRSGFCENKNKIFIDYFYNELKNEEHADLFAAGFSDPAWAYLSEKIKKEKFHSYSSYSGSNSAEKSDGFTALVMKWMINISSRLNDESFYKEMLEMRFDSSIWLFYSHASRFITENKSWKGLPEEMYENLAKAQNPLFLNRFFESFDETCQKSIATYLIKKEPKKFILWVNLLLSSEKKENLNDLFDKLSRIHLIDDAIKVLFCGVNIKNEVSVYCSLSNHHRIKILKKVLIEKEKGLKQLSDWISAINQNSQDLFGGDFYKNLMEIDPSFPRELKNILDTLPEVDKLFVDNLLFDLESLTPEEKQLRALEKLKLHFTKPNCSHDERQKFVSNLRDDLMLDHENTPLLIDKLFQHMPPSVWPLVFLHFDSILTYSHFDSYYEEKSKGGAFKRTRRIDPPLLEKRLEEVPMNDFAKERLQQMLNSPEKVNLDELFLWTRMERITEPFINQPYTKKGFTDPETLINICALTLTQMIDNPYLSSEDDLHDSSIGWTMQHLYQLACETNTIHFIIQRFMEITPVDKFFPTMERFSHSCFYSNKGGFKELIADCLEKANIDKTTFIVDCILSERKKTNQRILNLTADIWEFPILKDDRERAMIAKHLMKSLGTQYLATFLDDSIPNYTVIKALKNHDEVFCHDFFYEVIETLVKVTNKPSEKMNVFQKVSDCYAYAGYDIITLLSDYKVKPFLKEIENWYSTEKLTKTIDRGLSSLQLLRFFNKEAFYPVIAKKIEAILSHERYISFYNLHHILEKLSEMECIQDFMTFVKDTGSDLPELVKKGFELYPVQFLENKSSKLNELLYLFVPDWQKSLISWTKEEIRNKGRTERYFSDKDFPGVDNLYEILSEMNVLDSWLIDLEKSLPDEMKKDLERIYTQFSKKKTV